MTRIPIRNLKQIEGIPPRFCDVVIDEKGARLVRKNGRDYQEIHWDDLKDQVEDAIHRCKRI